MRSNEAIAAVRFAGFRYVEERRCLARDDGTEVALRPKTLETFRHLAVQADRVVERESLHRAVWNRTIVTDDSLGKCVAEIRHAIGDASHEVLRTVPRCGYMLVSDAPAADTAGEAVARAGAVAPSAPVAGGGQSSERWPWRRSLAAVFAVTLALALVHYLTGGPTASVAEPIATGDALASSAALPEVHGEGAASAASGASAATAVGAGDGAAPGTPAGDAAAIAEPERDGPLPTVSLDTAASDDPLERASLDAVVVALRAALGRHRGVALADGDTDYRLSIALRGAGAGAKRCLALELADAGGTIVFADAYPIDDARDPARAIGVPFAGSDAFWRELFARAVECAPGGDAAAAGASAVDRAGPQRERQGPPVPLDAAAAHRRRGRLLA